MIQTSYVIPVLNSHEIVRRQALHLARLLPDSWEVIFVDDGSEPPLRLEWAHSRHRIVPTGDKRPWTQPRARNIGVQTAVGTYVLIADVDHIATPDAILMCEQFTGKRLDFARRYGSLNERGEIINIGQQIKPSPSACFCRRNLYLAIGGYDESFCCHREARPGDDHDFNARWRQAYGQEERTDAPLLAFANSVDPTLFHGLSRGVKRDAQRARMMEAMAS